MRSKRFIWMDKKQRTSTLLSNHQIFHKVVSQYDNHFIYHRHISQPTIATKNYLCSYAKCQTLSFTTYVIIEYYLSSSKDFKNTYFWCLFYYAWFGYSSTHTRIIESIAHNLGIIWTRLTRWIFEYIQDKNRTSLLALSANSYHLSVRICSQLCCLFLLSFFHYKWSVELFQRFLSLPLSSYFL
jgi:hypothetical protein